jgi:hypothetical protein
MGKEVLISSYHAQNEIDNHRSISNNFQYHRHQFDMI